MSDPPLHLAPSTYGAPVRWARQRELLARSWSFVADHRALDAAASPTTFLEGALDEPLMIVRDDGRLRLLSNVCTHRAARLLDAPCDGLSIRCPYHGRRFGLDGTVRAAPGYEEPPDEPLPEVPHAELGPMLFGALEPAHPFDALMAPVADRLAFFDFDALAPDPASARAYTVEAPWPLWCDNYLEGLHIPYVHPRLAQTLDLERYSVETFERCALQVGEARPSEPAFELPDGHPDAGRRVAGYYLFLFPVTALNLYPWGLSLNAIEPLGPERTRIVYRAWTLRPELRDRGAGADLDRVEREDDAIVERAAAGVRSRLYRPGRLSERHEAAVRWFHARLAAATDAIG
ncbi:MAG TPA: SRPBCC family protein [Sandaracinaceae bacterium LLY-WYZ-13_1]|nr:SRPBCC family protein [Sandaracinaceae bacterium LLY-WYZ-13_1]